MASYYITYAALQKATEIAASNHGLEVNMIPTGHVVLHQEKNPLIHLPTKNDIRSIIVTGVFEPPFQIKQRGHTSILKDRVAESERACTQWLDKQQEQYLCTQRVGKLHTHPFSEGNYLSDGDLRNNLTVPLLEQWNQQENMPYIPMYLMYLSEDYRWKMSLWLDEDSSERNPRSNTRHPHLFQIQEVEDHHREVRIARRLTHQKVYPELVQQIMEALGCEEKQWHLPRGWLGFDVSKNNGRRRFTLTLPPQPWRKNIEIFVWVGVKPIKVHTIRMQQGADAVRMLCQQLKTWKTS